MGESTLNTRNLIGSGAAVGSLLLLAAPAFASTYDPYLCEMGYTEYCGTTATESSGTGGRDVQERTAGDELRAAAPVVPTAISRRLSNYSPGTRRTSTLENGSGLAAGDGGGKSWWIEGSWTGFENQHAALDFEGDVNTAIVGLDKRVDERTIWGVAFHAERTETELRAVGRRSEKSGAGFTPYLAYAIDDNYTLDANIGMAWLGVDEPGRDMDAQRFFGGVNLNGYWQYADWGLEGHVGWLHAQEDFSESSTGVTPDDTRMDRINLWGRINYVDGPYQPYFIAGYTNDVRSPERYDGTAAAPRTDHDNFELGAGFNYFSDNSLAFNIEATTVAAKDNVDQESIRASVRMAF